MKHRQPIIPPEIELTDFMQNRDKAELLHAVLHSLNSELDYLTSSKAHPRTLRKKRLQIENLEAYISEATGAFTDLLTELKEAHKGIYDLHVFNNKLTKCYEILGGNSNHLLPVPMSVIDYWISRIKTEQIPRQEIDVKKFENALLPTAIDLKKLEIAETKLEYLAKCLKAKQ